MGDLRTLTGNERIARAAEYRTWLGDVLQEKDNDHLSTEHHIDSIIEVLETAIDAMAVIEDVIQLGNDLLTEAADSPMSGVARAFNDEISRALMGKR